MTEHIEFTHLHTHTPEGSLLDGFMRIEKAVAKIKSLGMDALGVSDHGTMAAHYKFNEICKREGIHPIFATEGYLTWDKSFKKEDFEKVNIETDKEGNNIFAFMQKEEVAGSWMPISYFSTKKKQQEIERLAKSDYYPRLYEESFADPAMIPQKKTAYNKGMNALVKSYKEKGYELCIKADTSQRDFFEWFPWSGHLLLIAKNNEGYQNLLRLNNIANLEGFYGKPRFDYEDIKKYGKGIIATSSCMGGIAPQLILKGKLKEAKEELEKYREAFDEVYLELQPSRNPDQWVINNQLIEWSEELQMPLIATTDAHMVDKDEMELHKTLTNIGRGSNNYTEDESDISAYDSAYLMSQEEILENGIPRIALQNAYDLSHRCKVTFLDDIEVKYPEYDVPPGYTFDSYLEELAWNGLFDIFLKKDYIEDYQSYQERLAYELEVIKNKKLSAYFIIVWDYVKWAKEQGIYVGPGRGCTTKETTIFTEEGIKSIDNIIVGEKVYTHTGELKNVKNKFKYKVTENERLLKIRTFYDDYFGNTYTKDHKVLAVKTNRCKDERLLASGKKYLPSIDKKPQWIESKDLEVGDLVVSPKIIVNETKIESIDLSKYIGLEEKGFTIYKDYIQCTTGVNRPFKYSSKNIEKATGVNKTSIKRNINKWKENPTQDLRLKSEKIMWDYIGKEFSSIQSFVEYHSERTTNSFNIKRYVKMDEDLFYWIGLATGNGWIRRGRSDITVCFNTENEHKFYPELVKNIFGEIKVSSSMQRTNVINYTFYSHIISEFLKDIWPEYNFDSKTKSLNKIFLNSKEKNRIALIKGLWDTDGSHKGKSKYTSSSKKLIDDIRFLLSSLNIPNGLIFRKGRIKPNNHVVNNSDSWQIIIPNNYGHNYIQFYEQTDNYVLKRIRSIEEVEESYVYDIEVEDDHSYLTTSFAAHNSAAGSLVTYALSVTNLDPVKYNLLFQRFLNPDRPGNPDIDVDFSSHRRHEVVEYLKEKYGNNYVASIGTYQTMTSKAILKNVGKVMGIDHNIINDWNKNIPAPNGNPMPVKIAVKEIPVIKEAFEKHPELFELAMDLESMPKSKGVHASGFEVAPNNLLSNLPLWLGKEGDMVTQYEGAILENLGYIKLDILGVKVLSIIEIAVNIVKEKNNVDLNINELEFEDRETFKNIQSGNTLGVFQLASSGMTSIFTQLKYVDFDSLIAGIALYRPGPLQFLDTYIRRMNGQEKVTYLTPEMEKITKNTKGVILYQEQLMRIATDMGGYTAGESDSFRKSVGKKDEVLMLKSLDELNSRMIKKGYSKEITDSIIEQIKPFLGYGLITMFIKFYCTKIYHMIY